MSHRNMVWTNQAANLESERGPVQVQPESLYYGSTGSDLSNLGVQVAVGAPGNTTNVGICDLRNYYESINNQHQHVQNPYPHVGVDPSFVYPSTMYNPCMSTTAVNRYVPQTRSFGLGNPLQSPLHHQVVTGTMHESGSSGNFGDSTREFNKRKNEAVEGGHHFVHGFTSSSSSAHVPQNPAHGPWNASFESHGLPNAAASNPPAYHGDGWPFLEGSSADGPNWSNSMAAHPELVSHGNYVFPAGHMGRCNTWISQAANGIADGVPHWEYSNAVANPPGQFVHSGTIDMPNGSLHDYQAGPSAIHHGPLPQFRQNPVHSMPAPALLNHIQMQAPHRQGLINNVPHGVNPSGIGLPLDPRILAFASNSGHTFGPPMHPFLTNQVSNGNLRILPYENATLMNLSRLYEAGHAIDQHRDMRLDIDSMTYEELVALEEQIGVVNTGLKESYIQENLRSSFYVPGAAYMSDQSSVENDACIICQEEYKATELVGTLDCGHRYHAMCIKQWLMVKNVCPICKTTALSADRRNR